MSRCSNDHSIVSLQVFSGCLLLLVLFVALAITPSYSSAASWNVIDILVADDDDVKVDTTTDESEEDRGEKNSDEKVEVKDKGIEILDKVINTLSGTLERTEKMNKGVSGMTQRMRNYYEEQKRTEEINNQYIAQIKENLRKLREPLNGKPEQPPEQPSEEEQRHAAEVEADQELWQERKEEIRVELPKQIMADLKKQKQALESRSRKRRQQEARIRKSEQAEDDKARETYEARKKRDTEIEAYVREQHAKSQELRRQQIKKLSDEYYVKYMQRKEGLAEQERRRPALKGSVISHPQKSVQELKDDFRRTYPIATRIPGHVAYEKAFQGVEEAFKKLGPQQQKAVAAEHKSRKTKLKKELDTRNAARHAASLKADQELWDERKREAREELALQKYKEFLQKHEESLAVELNELDKQRVKWNCEVTQCEGEASQKGWLERQLNKEEADSGLLHWTYKVIEIIARDDDGESVFGNWFNFGSFAQKNTALVPAGDLVTDPQYSVGTRKESFRKRVADKKLQEEHEEKERVERPKRIMADQKKQKQVLGARQQRSKQNKARIRENQPAIDALALQQKEANDALAYESRKQRNAETKAYIFEQKEKGQEQRRQHVQKLVDDYHAESKRQQENRRPVPVTEIILDSRESTKEQRLRTYPIATRTPARVVMDGGLKQWFVEQEEKKNSGILARFSEGIALVTRTDDHEPVFEEPGRFVFSGRGRNAFTSSGTMATPPQPTIEERKADFRKRIADKKRQEEREEKARIAQLKGQGEIRDAKKLKAWQNKARMHEAQVTRDKLVAQAALGQSPVNGFESRNVSLPATPKPFAQSLRMSRSRDSWIYSPTTLFNILSEDDDDKLAGSDPVVPEALNNKAGINYPVTPRASSDDVILNPVRKYAFEARKKQDEKVPTPAPVGVKPVEGNSTAEGDLLYWPKKLIEIAWVDDDQQSLNSRQTMNNSFCPKGERTTCPAGINISQSLKDSDESESSLWSLPAKIVQIIIADDNDEQVQKQDYEARKQRNTETGTYIREQQEKGKEQSRQKAQELADKRYADVQKRQRQEKQKAHFETLGSQRKALDVQKLKNRQYRARVREANLKQQRQEEQKAYFTMLDDQNKARDIYRLSRRHRQDQWLEFKLEQQRKEKLARAHIETQESQNKTHNTYELQGGQLRVQAVEAQLVNGFTIPLNDMGSHPSLDDDPTDGVGGIGRRRRHTSKAPIWQEVLAPTIAHSSALGTEESGHASYGLDESKSKGKTKETQAKPVVNPVTKTEKKAEAAKTEDAVETVEPVAATAAVTTAEAAKEQDAAATQPATVSTPELTFKPIVQPAFDSALVVALPGTAADVVNHSAAQMFSGHHQAISDFRSNRIATGTDIERTDAANVAQSVKEGLAESLQIGGTYSYVRAYGKGSSAQAANSFAGYNNKGYGFEFGVFKVVDTELLAGVLAAAENNKASLRGKSGSVDVTSLRVGSFFSWERDNFHIDGALVFGHHEADAKGRDFINGDSYKGGFVMNDWAASIGTGYDIHLDALVPGLTLTPMAGFTLINGHTSGFDLKGRAGDRIKVKGNNHHGRIGRFGVMVDYQLPAAQYLTSIHGGFGVQKNHFTGQSVSMMSAGGNSTTEKRGQRDRQLQWYKLGAGSQLTETGSLSLDLEGSRGQSRRSYSASITFEQKF